MRWLVRRRIRHLEKRLLTLAEIMLLAPEHVEKLEPPERRRVLALVLSGRGRARILTPPQREELVALVAKAEPRLFVGRAADKLAPSGCPSGWSQAARR